MESNCSLASVNERFQEVKFQESDPRLEKETKDVYSKMENSYKESFSQVKFQSRAK